VTTNPQFNSLSQYFIRSILRPSVNGTDASAYTRTARTSQTFVRSQQTTTAHNCRGVVGYCCLPSAFVGSFSS